MAEHAEWCDVAFDKPCDCGGNGGACPVCGARGPCEFTDDGVPLIHTRAIEDEIYGDPREVEKERTR